MKRLTILVTILLLSAVPALAAQSHGALHHSFSRSLVIGIALLLLVQAGHLVYRRVSRGTRLSRLQRNRRNRPG